MYSPVYNRVYLHIVTGGWESRYPEAVSNAFDETADPRFIFAQLNGGKKLPLPCNDATDACAHLPVNRHSRHIEIQGRLSVILSKPQRLTHIGQLLCKMSL